MSKLFIFHLQLHQVRAWSSMDTARAPEEDMNQIIKRIAGLNSQTEAQIAFRELKLKKSEVFEITTQVHSIFKRNWEKQPAYRGVFVPPMFLTFTAYSLLFLPLVHVDSSFRCFTVRGFFLI